MRNAAKHLSTEILAAICAELVLCKDPNGTENIYDIAYCALKKKVRSADKAKDMIKKKMGW